MVTHGWPTPQANLKAVQWDPAGRVRERVVWSSNREDNHELYLVDQRPATNSRPSAGSGTPGGRSIDVIFGTSNRRTISRKKISAIRT